MNTSQPFTNQATKHFLWPTDGSASRLRFRNLTSERENKLIERYSEVLTLYKSGFLSCVKTHPHVDKVRSSSNCRKPQPPTARTKNKANEGDFTFHVSILHRASMGEDRADQTRGSKRQSRAVKRGQRCSVPPRDAPFLVCPLDVTPMTSSVVLFTHLSPSAAEGSLLVPVSLLTQTHRA